MSLNIHKPCILGQKFERKEVLNKLELKLIVKRKPISKQYIAHICQSDEIFFVKRSLDEKLKKYFRCTDQMAKKVIHFPKAPVSQSTLQAHLYV